jgi:hypothetical protein
LRLERHGYTRTRHARVGHHESDHENAADHSGGDPRGEACDRRKARST